MEAIERITNFEPLSLNRLVEEMIPDAAYEARQRQSSVLFRASDQCTILGNRQLLHRAIENVIRNAIRYTKSGSEVEIRLTSALKQQGRVALLEVSDRGPGIPENELDAIFLPFYRVDHARSPHTGGSGVGLAIAERAVKLHGGDLRAFNRPDGGATLQMQLPALEGARGKERDGTSQDTRLSGSEGQPPTHPLPSDGLNYSGIGVSVRCVSTPQVFPAVAIHGATVAYSSVGPTVGPITISAGCFLLFQALIGSAKPFRLCYCSRIGVGEVASSNLVVPTITSNQLVSSHVPRGSRPWGWSPSNSGAQSTWDSSVGSEVRRVHDEDQPEKGCRAFERRARLGHRPSHGQEPRVRSLRALILLRAAPQLGVGSGQAGRPIPRGPGA